MKRIYAKLRDFIDLLHVYLTMTEALKIAAISRFKYPAQPAARSRPNSSARVLFVMGDNADHASLCINAGCMPSKAMFEPDRLPGASVS